MAAHTVEAGLESATAEPAGTSGRSLAVTAPEAVAYIRERGGRITFPEFWETSCGRCLRYAPTLGEPALEYGPLGVDVNEVRTSIEHLKIPEDSVHCFAKIEALMSGSSTRT